MHYTSLAGSRRVDAGALRAGIHHPLDPRVIAQQGQEMVGNSPERFREIVKAEVAKWAGVIKELGLQLD